MKLIIQIPCFNEQYSLPITLPLIPRQVPGFDEVEILVIDDGSKDQTARIAQEWGVDHIVRLTRNQGLARAFSAGINKCLELKADIIVNIDADNQYNAADIDRLTAPLLAQEADITIGVRPIADIQNFSRVKKFLQKFGTLIVARLSKTDIADATSGFRAMTADVALRVNIFTKYTYTLEMILQASEKHLHIQNVPIRVNDFLRPSRLARSTFSYVYHSCMSIIDVLMIYQAFRFLFTIGIIIISVGILFGFNDFRSAWIRQGTGHGPYLILFNTFIVVGWLTIMTGFLARIQSANRKILEDIQYRSGKKLSALI